jgi:hypothetical protein
MFQTPIAELWTKLENDVRKETVSTIDWEAPIQVRHRETVVWTDASAKRTIFHNWSVSFGGDQFVIVVDRDGQPIENMRGFPYKEYVVENQP